MESTTVLVKPNTAVFIIAFLIAMYVPYTIGFFSFGPLGSAICALTGFSCFLLGYCLARFYKGRI